MSTGAWSRAATIASSSTQRSASSSPTGQLHFDTDTGRYYTVDLETGKITWYNPDPVPASSPAYEDLPPQYNTLLPSAPPLDDSLPIARAHSYSPPSNTPPTPPLRTRFTRKSYAAPVRPFPPDTSRDVDYARRLAQEETDEEIAKRLQEEEDELHAQEVAATLKQDHTKLAH
ncbi:hypothetical protein HK104_005666, partial [Borealophlyctis nickersoniae]